MANRRVWRRRGVPDGGRIRNRMRPAWPECPGKSPPRRNRSAPRAHPARPAPRRLSGHPCARFLGGGAGGGLGLAKFLGLDDTPSPTRTKRFEGGGIGSLAMIHSSVPSSGEALTNSTISTSPTGIKIAEISGAFFFCHLKLRIRPD